MGIDQSSKLNDGCRSLIEDTLFAEQSYNGISFRCNCSSFSYFSPFLLVMSEFSDVSALRSSCNFRRNIYLVFDLVASAHKESLSRVLGDAPGPEERASVFTLLIPCARKQSGVNDENQRSEQTVADGK